MDVLERLLFDLKSCAEDPNSVISCSDVASNIAHHCTYNLDLVETELDHVLFFLAQSDSPPNIFQFVSIRTKDKDLIKAKVVLLKFLANLIKQVGLGVGDVGQVIFSACIENFKRDESNEVKAGCLLPVKNMLRLVGDGFTFDEDCFQLESLYSLLINQFLSKKSTSGIKYNILVTLGYLTKEYYDSAATAAKADQVASILWKVLHGGFSGKSKAAIDLSLLAGAFSCLDRCLFNFEGHFIASSEQSADMWKFIMMAISGISSDVLNRFKVVGKALRVIKNHSSLFSRMIVLNMSTSFRSCLVCYFSDRDVCRKHADDAILSMLSELSRSILNNAVSTGGDKETEAEFRSATESFIGIIDQLLKFLQSGCSNHEPILEMEGKAKSGNRKISLGVKGIAALAPAIAVVNIKNTHVIPILMKSCDDILLDIDAAEQKPETESELVSSVNPESNFNPEGVMRRAQFLLALVTTMHSELCMIPKNRGAVNKSIENHVDSSSLRISSSLHRFLLSNALNISMSYTTLGATASRSARSALCIYLRAIAFPFGKDALSCPELSITSILNDSLANIVSVLLIKSITRTEIEDGEYRLPYEYFDLWREMLRPVDSDTRRFIELMEEGEKVSETHFTVGAESYRCSVFPIFVVSLLAEVGKLLRAFDLSYVLPESGGGDDATASQKIHNPFPKNASDHELLLNLVTFLEDLSPVVCEELCLIGNPDSNFENIRSWVEILRSEAMHLSACFPLVSALYRIFSVFNYWDSHFECSRSQYIPNTVGSIREKESNDHMGCFQDAIIQFFVDVSQNILTVFHHPELIESAMKMIFQSPRSLLTHPDLVVHVYFPLLSLSLRSGMLVGLAIHILFIYLDEDNMSEVNENSCGEITSSRILSDQTLCQLVPLLEKYLKDASDASSEIDGKMVTKSKKKRVKLLKKDGKTTYRNFMIGGNGYEEERTQNDRNYDEGLPVKILRFLGRLGGRNKYILSSPISSISSSLKWACFQGFITVNVPVASALLSGAQSSQNSQSQQNSLMEINVGATLPRLVSLCADANPSNKELTIYAQECLHGIILVMIGRSSQAASDLQCDYLSMFNAVFPIIIELAASDEELTKNLFDKLLFQIIHWLSSFSGGGANTSHLSDIYTSLLDILIDGCSGMLVNTSSHSISYSIGSSRSAAVKEKCVQGVVEYFRWACKVSPGSKGGGESALSTSADGILSRLLTNATHPLEHKRVGAIQVLNRLYVYFREDLSLVLKYCLRVVFALLNAVRQPGSGVSRSSCALAIRHFVKIMIKISNNDEVDAALLRQGRWIDKKIKNSQDLFSYDYDISMKSEQPTFPYTLRDLLSWLWLHVASEDYVFRRQCMLCISELCLLIPCPKVSLMPSNSLDKQPPHLCAISRCLFSGIFFGNTAARSIESILEAVSSDFVTPLGVSFRCLAKSQQSQENNPVSHCTFYFSHTKSNCVVLCDQEVSWLKSLNGSLDAFNFMITCVEGCVGSSLFVGDIESTSIDETVGNKMSKKRQRTVDTKTLDLHSEVPDCKTLASSGKLLLWNIKRFFACCFNLLVLRAKLPCSKVMSSKLVLQCLVQESLIAEVLRRICQLMTTLLKSEPEYFCKYFSKAGVLCEGDAGYHFATFIQIVLFAALVPIEPYNIATLKLDRLPLGRSSSSLLGVQETLSTLLTPSEGRFSEFISVAEREANGDSKVHDSTFSSDFVSSVYLFQMSMTADIPKRHDVNDVVDGQSMELEITLYLPIAIKELFRQSTSSAPLMSALVWPAILAASVLTLSTIRFEDMIARKVRYIGHAVDALSRTLRHFHDIGLHQKWFDEGSSTLKLLGCYVTHCVINNFSNGDSQTSRSFITPLKVSLGDSLLLFAVKELHYPLVSTSEGGMDSVISMIMDQDVPTAIKVIDTYGDLVVDLCFQTTKESSASLQLTNMIEFLVAMLERVHLNKYEVLFVPLKVLLRKILLAVPERTEDMDPETILKILSCLMTFVMKEKNANVLTTEQLVLLLHIESMLPTSVRSTSKEFFEFHRYILQRILNLFNNVKSESASEWSVNSISEAFTLLPFIFPQGCTLSSPCPLSNSDTAEENLIVEEVMASLEEVVAAKFPLKSTSLDASSQEGKDFAKILRAWLDCFTSSGNVSLLKPLQFSFREGREHRYYHWFKDSIAQFVQDIDYEIDNVDLDKSGDGVPHMALFVCDEAFSVVFDQYQEKEVKFMYLDQICLPILLRCSSASLRSLLCQTNRSCFLNSNSSHNGAFIKQVMNIISKNVDLLNKGTVDDETSTHLLQCCCSFAILETVYDRCNVDDLKGPITKAFAESDSAKGSELTQAICRMTHKMVRQNFSKSGQNTHEALLQRAYSSAYNTLLIVVAKTQTEEKFYDNFLFAEKSGQGFWSNVIDCQIRYNFEDESCRKFPTVFMGGFLKFELEHAGKRGVEKSDSNALRKRKLTTLTGHSQAALQDSNNLLADSNVKKARINSSLRGINRTSSSLSSQQFHRMSEAGIVDPSAPEDPSDPFVVFSQSQSGLQQNSAAEFDVTSSQSEMDVVKNVYFGGSKDNTVKGLDDHTIALELNHINEQKCMGMLLRVLQRMNVLFQNKWKNASNGPAPTWVRTCAKNLEDFSCINNFSSDGTNDRRNIRLFFLRLLLNQPVASMVKSYIPNTLLLPILKCCLHDLCGLKPMGNGLVESNQNRSDHIHYMLRDVIFTLVDSDWSSEIPENDMFSELETSGQEVNFGNISQCKALLLSHLLKCISGSVGGNSFEEDTRSICALIEMWVSGENSFECLRDGIDLAPVVDLISTSESAPTGGAHAKATSTGSINVKRRLCGYHILDVLVKSGYPIFLPESTYGKDILQSVCNGCGYPRKEVYEKCAGVAGSVLQSIEGVSSNASEDSGRFSMNLNKKLISMLALKDGYDIVAVCLRAICKQHPSFMNREIVLKMIGGFGKLKSRTKVDFLDALCTSTNSPPDHHTNASQLSSTKASTSAAARVFEGISIVQSMRPYIPSLLNDVSTVAIGRGSKARNVPMLQLLTLRLIKGHCKDFVELNILPSLACDVASGDQQRGFVAFDKVLSEDALIEIRLEAYSMLMCLHTEIMDLLQSSQTTNDEISTQLALVRMLLLKGLTDPDDRGMMHQSSESKNCDHFPLGIRRQVFDFFQEHFGFSTCPVERLCTLLSDLFDPVRNVMGGAASSGCMYEVTNQWLRYSSYLMLRASDAALGDRHNTLLFSSGLASDDKFSMLSLNSEVSFENDKATTRSTPMFSYENSQSQWASLSQSNPSQFLSLTGGGKIKTPLNKRFHGGLLKGTQQFSWTQTQNQKSAGFANQIGNKSIARNQIDISSQERQFYTQFMGGDSSGDNKKFQNKSTIQLSLSQQGDLSQVLMPPPSAFPSQSTEPSDADFPLVNVVTQRVPLRYGGGGNDNNMSSQSSRHWDRARNQNNKRYYPRNPSRRVSLYRRYRQGELPDICISVMDVLGPLQSLCLRDPVMASIVFEELFQKLFDASAKQAMSSSMKLALCESLHFALSGTKLAQNSCQSKSIALVDTSLAHSLMSALHYCISHELKLLQSNNTSEARLDNLQFINVDAIGNTSLASLNFHSGIQVMEQFMLYLQTTHSCRSTLHRGLVQLGRLYSALGDNNTLIGMLYQLCSLEESRQALSMEVGNGNYSKAIELYNNLLTSDSAVRPSNDNEGVFSDEEVDMWRKRSLDCVGKLLDWEQLHEQVNILSSQAISPIGESSKSKPFIEKLLLCAKNYNCDEDLMVWLLPHYIKSISKIGGNVVCPLRFSMTCHGDKIDSSSDGLAITRARYEEVEYFLTKSLQPQNCQDPDDKRLIYKTKHYLESNLPSDLSLCFMSVEQWSRTQQYADESYQKFLNSWVSLHSAAVTSRSVLLSSLQKIVEIEDSLSLMTSCSHKQAGGVNSLNKCTTKEGEISSERQMDILLSRWKHSSPDLMDSLVVWDDISRIRSLCLARHVQNLAGQTICSSLGKKAASLLNSLHIDIAISAIAQGNLQVAKEQIGVSSAYGKAIGMIEHQLYGQKKGKNQARSMKEVVAVYAFNKRYVESGLNGDVEDSSDSILLRYEKTMDLLDSKKKSCEKYAGSSVDSEEASDLLRIQLMRAEWSASWAKYLASQRSTSKAQEVVHTSYQLFHEVVRSLDEDARETSVELSGQAHGKFAKHCDDMLTNFSEWGIEMSAEDIATAAIGNYLAGMMKGDKFSRDHVLRILSLTGEYAFNEKDSNSTKSSGGKKRGDKSNDQTTKIIRLMHEIPAWMYLRFAPQIMGCIDRPEGHLAVAVLEHIANCYPRALYYPFKVSYPSLSSRGKELVNCKLAGMLRDDLSDIFVQSLQGLTHPELRWTDGLKYVVALLELNKLQEAEAAIDELRINCCELEWEGVGDKIGQYNEKYARFRSKKGKSSAPSRSSDAKKNIKALSNLNPDVSTLLSSLNATFDVPGVRSLLKKANREEEGWQMKHKSGKVALSEFSQWLSELGSLLLTLSSINYPLRGGSGMGSDFMYKSIEIPGQYAVAVERDKPPMPDQHSKILSVDPQLLVMSSIRKPKRIGLIGSGGEMHYFLVKGGEDLRNDQRIEELFVLMNRILCDYSSSIRQSPNDKFLNFDLLQVRSFNVIPMTPRVGLLEWVTNTTPLKSIITSEMQKDNLFVNQNPGFILDDGEGELQCIRASEERAKWLKGNYHKMFRNAKAEQAEKLHDRLRQLVPDYYLRRRFVRVSSSAEAFLTLRSECAKSLAASCIFGYILGLGDRHLENLLLDEKSGGIVQIDFGICFGMGTSILPVPEFIPFRLTNQLIGLFRPLDGTNILRNLMINALKPLRAEAGMQVLSNALEVYVNDPVIDWLKGPLDKENDDESGGFAALRDDVTWEPRRRVANAVRKLNGVHPATLLIEDLELNNSVLAEKSLTALKEILWQSVKGISKAKHDNIIDCSTQVDLLLAIATSPNVLVRQWVGLLTWI